ncbi:MAG TPA: hypothetical protein DEQ38_06810, partial [Elusimicrobia bacterium]|nr:hypothetical protein [Elusimicrobiota bacterium]
MIYLLSLVIVILLFVIGSLLRKVYTLRLEKPGCEAEGRDNSLKTTWGKFDELLTSLLTIHEIGIVSAGTIKKEDFYQTVVESACELINSPRGSLMIHDAQADELRICASK